MNKKKSFINQKKNYKGSIKNICCIGAGYVGGPTMAVIADKCNSIIVNVVDIDQNRINAWNDPDFQKIPIYETGLVSILKRTRGINLHFSTNIEEAISAADIIFISVNTPTKIKGLGAGKASNLSWIEKCARQIAKFSQNKTIVVEKSTVPVQTAEVIKTILNSSCPPNSSKRFSILSNPEFLAEGSAINDLEKPDRVLIGGDDQESIEVLSEIYKTWVPESKIIRTNIWSSELSKLIANAFLAQRISSINSISALCEATGANIKEVEKAIGSDRRIGNKFLKAGPGFGGSCFQKDILNLVYLCRHFDLEEVADYWEAVIRVNNYQKNRISKLIIQKLFGNLNNKKIGILGFAFKNGTNDTRESPAIQIVKDLLNEGAQINIHDPKVKPSDIEKELEVEQYKINIINKSNQNYDGTWVYKKTIKETIETAHAVVILTEWDEYTNLDWGELSKKMVKPSWLFDARSLINFDSLKEVEIFSWQVGNGQT